MSHTDHLFKKYDQPVPRYTSYPTVPHWQSATWSVTAWEKAVQQGFAETNDAYGISLYIHLPFCESLCTYCACNTRITKNHAVEEKYIEALLQEWSLYKKLFKQTPIVRELHLGGGTPTFFSPKNLHRLLTYLLEDVVLYPDVEFSFEGHPNNTTEEHLEVLRQLNFTRVSYGVQDLNEQVQKAIHRLQPLDNVQRVVEQSRKQGFTSISFDLVYGLPFQTEASVNDTMQQVLELKPDRLSFYSYAHVPWLKPGQRGYEDADLPTDVRKRALYETGRSMLLSAGYIEIGMDHFALPHDSLVKAMLATKLHRNFMGYTTTNTRMLIGLGVSAISETPQGYAQNVKSVEEYESIVNRGELAVIKGHVHADDDQLRKQVILAIACEGFVPLAKIKSLLNEEMMHRLAIMEEEGLLSITVSGLEVSLLGRAFIRTICSVFDKYLETSNQNLFSKAI